MRVQCMSMRLVRSPQVLCTLFAVSAYVLGSTDADAFGRREGLSAQLNTESEWHGGWVPEGVQAHAWAEAKVAAAMAPDNSSHARAFLFPLFREFSNVHGQIRDVLRRSVALLEEAHAPYAAASGTLLGILRDADVLPFDTDADIALAVPEGFEALAAAVGGVVAPDPAAQRFADGGFLVGSSARHGVKVLRYGTQWKLLHAGPGVGVGIDIWPVYRSFKRQEGRQYLKFLRQGVNVAKENPSHAAIMLANLTSAAGPLGFKIRVPPRDLALQTLRYEYGDDCMKRVNVWNAEINNEHLDPKHNKRRWSFSVDVFHAVLKEWRDANARRHG